jgi:DNA replication and repair protein RecF
MLAVLADYDRVVRQRNSLLKTARTSRTSSSQLGTLDIWDARLIEFGTQIITARTELIQELLPFVVRAYGTVAGAEHEVRLTAALSIHGTKEAMHVGVEPSVEGSVDADFAAAIRTNRRAELERGVTLVGPHRDDLVVTLNELPARGYASHGESWSLALALKLASAELLRVNSPLGDPVLILDDVFAELDNSRRGRLSTAIAGFEQVLITAAVMADVPESLRERVIRIRNGEIVEDDE